MYRKSVGTIFIGAAAGGIIHGSLQVTTIRCYDYSLPHTYYLMVIVHLGVPSAVMCTMRILSLYFVGWFEDDKSGVCRLGAKNLV